MAQVLQPGVGDEQLVRGRREPLAQRGGLRGDVVAAPRQHQLGVLGRAAGEPGEQRHRPVPNVLQGEPDLQLLDVLGEVAAGHPLVHVLVPGERAELLDPRLDVVAGDPLARRDRGEVDLLDDPLVVRDRLLGDVDAQVALRAQHRDPQPPLQHDLVLRRPQRDELGAGVPRGEDVGDHVEEAYVAEFGEQRGAGGGAGVRVGLDEAVHDGAVDDGDEPMERGGAELVPGPTEDREEQRVELRARRPHQRRQVGPPAGGDEPLVAQEHGVEARAARVRPEQLVEHQLDEGGRRGVARQRLQVCPDLVELVAAGAFGGGGDEVVEGGEVVRGGRERQPRLLGDGPVPHGLEPAGAQQVGRGADQQRTPALALLRGHPTSVPRPVRTGCAHPGWLVHTPHAVHEGAAVCTSLLEPGGEVGHRRFEAVRERRRVARAVGAGGHDDGAAGCRGRGSGAVRRLRDRRQAAGR